MLGHRRGAVPWLALLIAVACLAAVLYLLLQGSGNGATNPEPAPKSAGTETGTPPGAAALNGPGVEQVSDAPNERRSVSTTPSVVRETGPVSGRVVGMIADEQGNHLPEAKVVLTERVTPSLMLAEDAPPARRYLSVTDADGRFAFQTLPSGTDFDMWVFHPQHTPTPGVPVVGVEGEDQDLGVIRLRSGGRVYGKVTDTGGNPLPAKIELLMQPTGFRTGTMQDQLAEDQELGRDILGTADGNGDFDIKNLAEGVWTITASYEGYASAQVHPVVLMQDSRESKQDLQLDTEYQIGGIVLDETRNPVAGASINAARSRPRPSLNSTTVSGPDGRFLVRGLQDGMYSVFVLADGYSPARQIQAPAGKMDLELILAKKGGVSGRVVDDAGRPVASCTLEVHHIAKGTSSYGPTANRVANNSPDGNYQIEGLDPGPYILLVSAPGFAPTYSPGFQVDRDMVQGVDVQLHRGGTLTGAVVDAAGQPLAGAYIRLHGHDYTEEGQFGLFGATLGDPNNVPAQTARSNSQGRFELKNVFPGDLNLEIGHTLFISQYVPLSLADGDSRDLGVIQLHPGGTVSGVVLREDGSTVAGGTVYLTKPQGGANDGEAFFSQTRTTDARGRFRLDGLRAGNYELSATPPDLSGSLFLNMEDGAQTVYISEGKEVTLELHIPQDN